MEARVVHAQLADLVAKKHPLLLAGAAGSTGENANPNSFAAAALGTGAGNVRSFQPRVVKAVVEIVAGVAKVDSKSKAVLARELASLSKDEVESAVKAAELSKCKSRVLMAALTEAQTLA